MVLSNNPLPEGPDRADSSCTNNTEGECLHCVTCIETVTFLTTAFNRLVFFPASLTISLVIAHQQELNVLSVKGSTAKTAVRIINASVDNARVLIVWPLCRGKEACEVHTVCSVRSAEDGMRAAGSSHTRESHSAASVCLKGS